MEQQKNKLIMVWNHGDLPSNARLRIFYKLTEYSVKAYSPDDMNNTTIIEWDNFLSIDDFSDQYLAPRVANRTKIEG